MAESVIIIGGGLAGLAAAAALAPRGVRVTVLESRGRLGGRASSFQDAATGHLIDACQHVSMGCCTNFDHFCRTVGIAHLLKPEPKLYFMTPNGRVSVFQAGRLPAPLHLARSFWRAHFLTLGDKLRIAWGLACLKRSSPAADPPFQDWLRDHRQTARTVDRFWGVVLTSALNETPDRVGLKYARKVFVESFLGHRRGFEVQLPRVPLVRLYGEELQSWLEHHGVQVRTNCGVRKLVTDGERVMQVELRDEAAAVADWYIAAVPFDRFLDLLPSETVATQSAFQKLKHLGHSPITSIHLWYDRSVTELPHVVLIGCLGQWVFQRDDNYLQVVVSAARQFRGLGHEEVQRQIVEELARLFPRAQPEHVRRARVVTEHMATFSAIPGVDRWRPGQATPIGNLFLAGDWTATGWPATMEGAVRSGYLAAEALLRRSGRPAQLLQLDL